MISAIGQKLYWTGVFLAFGFGLGLDIVLSESFTFWAFLLDIAGAFGSWLTFGLLLAFALVKG